MPLRPFSTMKNDPVDIVEQQDEFAAHCWRFCLWPKKWQDCKVLASASWETRKLERQQKQVIPTSPGIYTLVIKPNIASHPNGAYLMYVGQAVDLRDRFGKYITTERRRRPKVFRLLLKWEGHIFFCFTKVKASDLDSVEDALISSFLPPANSAFPGELRPVVGAF